MALEDRDPFAPGVGSGYRFPHQEPRFNNLPPAEPVRFGQDGGGGGECPGGCPPGTTCGRGGHPGNPLRCRPSGAGGGAGAAGPARAAGGAGGAAGIPGVGVNDGTDFEGIIRNHILTAMKGFDAPTLDRMKGQVFSAAMGRKAAGLESVNEDLVSRGLARSGIGAEAAIDLENKAQAEYTGGVTNIMIKEVDYKMQALDRAQKHLDSLRDYIVSRESNAIQREIGLAQIKVAYAKIAAEKENLQLTLAARGGGGGGGAPDPFEQFMRLAGAQF